MNTLKLDLNELVNQEVAQKIDSLKKQVFNTELELKTIRHQKDRLEKTIEDSKQILPLLNKIRQTFSSITSNDSGFSKQRSQFMFIETILLNIFNIKKEKKGWYCYKNEGSLKAHLAVNYYSNKETVIELLNILIQDSRDIVSFIRHFKMPFDYTREQIIDFVKSPKTNTNSTYFQISGHWLRDPMGGKNVPYHLIMENTFIVEEDIFELLINSIEKRVNNYYYLFALPKYNKKVSKEQVSKLGELLLTLNPTYLNHEVVKEFISSNIKDFNDSTLEFLYTRINSNNSFNFLYWEKFPVKYQMRFLKSKTIDVVLKILGNHNCSWLAEDKIEFFKKLHCSLLIHIIFNITKLI